MGRYEEDKMANAVDIANVFAEARQLKRSIDAFPGDLPVSLTDAYSIQDYELDRLHQLPGWKVAAIRPDLREGLGAERLAGPIVHLIEAKARGEPIDVQTILGGFAAVEAEFALRLGRDLPLSGEAYSNEEILAAVAAMHIASEIAGSPLSTLSDLGPTAVISDHGNNAAVIIGAEISNWRERKPESFEAQTLINGSAVGQGDVSRLPSGGPIGSLAFLVNHLAQRGRYLKAGDWIATGATTGVHRVSAGDLAVIDFGDDGRLEIRIN